VVDVAAAPFDFESGGFGALVPGPGWTVAADDAAFGNRAAVVTGVGNGGSSALRLDVQVDAVRGTSVSYFFKVDGAAGDGLRVFVDGVEDPSHAVSGFRDWSSNTVFVPPSTTANHTIE